MIISLHTTLHNQELQRISIFWKNKKFPRTVFLDAFLKVTEPKNALIGTSESENAVTGNQ